MNYVKQEIKFPVAKRLHFYSATMKKFDRSLKIQDIHNS